MQEPNFTSQQYCWAQFDLNGIGRALFVPVKGGGSRQMGGSVDLQLFDKNIDAIRERRVSGYPAASAEIHRNDDGPISLEIIDPDRNELNIMG